jgi:hypothetical protein
MDVDSIVLVGCGKGNGIDTFFDTLRKAEGTATMNTNLNRLANQSESRLSFKTSNARDNGYYRPTQNWKTPKHVNFSRVKNIDLCTSVIDGIPFRLSIFIPNPKSIYKSNKCRDLDLLALVIASNLARFHAFETPHPQNNKDYQKFIEVLPFFHGAYGTKNLFAPGNTDPTKTSNTQKSNSLTDASHFYQGVFYQIGLMATFYTDIEIKDFIESYGQLPFGHMHYGPDTVRMAAKEINDNKVVVFQAVGLKRLKNMSTKLEEVDLTDSDSINKMYAENAPILMNKIRKLFGEPLPSFNKRFFMCPDFGINFRPTVMGATFVPNLSKCTENAKLMLLRFKDSGNQRQDMQHTDSLQSKLQAHMHKHTQTSTCVI